MAELTTRTGAEPWRPALLGAGPALVLGPLVVLGIAQLLPSTGVGLAVRLAAALVCLLVVPGALAQRAIGQPAQFGVGVAGALMWSLGFVALGLAITFALGRSLSLTLVVVGVAAAVSLGAGLGVRSPAGWRSDVRPVAFVVTLGLLLGVAVWWVSETIQGDGLFHLGRVRKLDELAALESVGSLNEFADGGLHPGYAFPVWHAVLALVARLADVDPGAVVQYGPALLVPLALVVTYAAGQALFGSWAGGVATVAAQVGLVAFARGGVGSLELLTLPPAAARLLLVPALLALVFAYLRRPRRALLPAIALGALALAIVHGSYMVFVCLLIAGYAGARLITETRESLPDLRRIATIFVALLIPFGAFLAWLVPVLRETASIRPNAAETARALETYSEALVVSGDSFRLSADTVLRGGVVAIVAFLALPVFVVAMRRRYAALVVGGVLAMLAVALVPPIFTEFSELISLSQARRLPGFLPLAFALAGGAIAFARWRQRAVGLTLVLSALLVAFYRSGTNVEWEAGWAVWLGLAGALVALMLGRWVAGRGLGREWFGSEGRAALVAAAVLLPVAIDGLRQLEREPPDPRALPAGLVQEVRRGVAPGEVVFADLETAYRLTAAAPIRVAAAPPAHVAQTTPNRPFERRRDVITFFYRPGVADAERLGVLERYDAIWLVVDRTRGFPEELIARLEPGVYDDGRYALLRVRDF